MYIVEDDISVATAFARIARAAKFEPTTFLSVEELLLADLPTDQACVVCDVQLPGVSGLELPRLLASAGKQLPVIIVTGDANCTSDRARQAGAVAFFRKPVDDQALLDAISWAVVGASKN